MELPTLKPCWNFLVKPRLTPLLFALLLNIAFFYWLMQHIQTQAALGPIDDYSYVATVIKYRYVPDRPGAVLLGGSNARDAINNRLAVEKAINNKTHGHYQFWNLGTPFQSSADSLAIFDSLPMKPGSIVFVTINMSRLARSKEQITAYIKANRIPFLATDAVNKALQHAGIDISNIPAFMRARLWLKRYISIYSGLSQAICLKLPFSKYRLGCFKPLVTTNVLFPIPGKFYQRSIHEAHDKKPLDENTKLVHQQQQTLIRTRAFKHYHEFNLSVFKALVQLAKQRDIKVVFLQLPTDTRYQEASKYIQQQLDDDIKQLTELGASFYDLRAKGDLSNDDFIDLTHMTLDGREKFSPIITNSIADIVEKYAHGKP